MSDDQEGRDPTAEHPIVTATPYEPETRSEPQKNPRPSDEANGAPTRPTRRQRKGFFARHVLGTAVAALVVVVVVVIVIGVFWYRSAEKGHPGAGVVVDVKSGETFGQVRSELEHDGVITDSLAFRIYMVVHAAPTVEAGEYYLQKDMSFGNVVGILEDPPNVLSLQIPPGFTVAEISDRLEAAGYETLGEQFGDLSTAGTVKSPFQPAGSKNLDGLLGTGTYKVLPVESARTLMLQMVDRFTRMAESQGLKPGSTINGYDAYEVVTIASIDEKEGVIPKNLGKVARVIYNRLSRGMPLQMDSTVLYALGQDGGTVTPSDLRIESPYNSYLNTGLTPTPISFPSEQALDAAIRPPAGDWLYFTLISEDGTEGFSDTYAGQVANENLARQRGLP